jgi:integrase
MSKPEKNKVKNGLVFSGKSWSYVLRVPDQVTGRTKPQWVGGFDSASSAKVARDKARVALANRDYVAPTKTTLGEFLNAWIEIHARHIKPTTLDGYKKLIKNYIVPGIGSIKLQDLRPSHIEAFYSELLNSAGMTGKGLSPSSVVRCGAVLKKALRYAVEVEGVLSINPASRVPLPKERPVTPTPWNIAELNSFLEVSKSHRLSFYFRLSAFTGARRGELLALNWSDFDGKAITISKSRTEINGAVIEQNTTKGGTNGQRRVPLDTETIELFTAHRKRQLIERMALGEAWQETGYIFVQENGLPLYPTTVTSLFSKLSIGAGLRPIRLHDLRHIHATELLRLGEPLHVVAKRLGHRDAMVTATIYAHVSSEQSETASSRFANAVSGNS